MQLRTAFLSAAAVSWLLTGLALAADEIDFNRDIRPILSENCFYCHGQDGNKREADLRLDVRAAALEAKAIVPVTARPALWLRGFMRPMNRRCRR